MNRKDFMPKLPVKVCVALMTVAFAVVMRNGITAVQNVSEGTGLSVDPLDAMLATALMAAIGFLVYVKRRTHGR